MLTRVDVDGIFQNPVTSTLKMESLNSRNVNVTSTFWNADPSILLVDVWVWYKHKQRRQQCSSGGCGSSTSRQCAAGDPNVYSCWWELTSQKFTTNYTILKDSPSGLWYVEFFEQWKQLSLKNKTMCKTMFCLQCRKLRWHLLRITKSKICMTH